MLTSGDNVRITNPEYSSTIVYRGAERKDTSKYTITVANEYGKDTADIEVIVLGV